MISYESLDSDEKVWVEALRSEKVKPWSKAEEKRAKEISDLIFKLQSIGDEWEEFYTDGDGELVKTYTLKFPGRKQTEACIYKNWMVYVKNWDENDKRVKQGAKVKGTIYYDISDDGDIIDENYIGYKTLADAEHALQLYIQEVKKVYIKEEKQINRVTEGDSKMDYKSFMSLLGKSKRYEFDGSVITIMDYNTGDSVKLDLDRLSKSEFYDILADEETGETLLAKFLRYHDDGDNYFSHKEQFDAMYKILDKYGDSEETVDVKFRRASYKDQMEMLDLIAPGKELYNEFKAIIHSSMRYSMDGTVLTVESYRYGNFIDIDLGQLDESTYEKLLVDEISESSDIKSVTNKILEGVSVRNVISKAVCK